MVGLAPASKNAPSGVQPTSFPGLCTAEGRRIANYEWRKLLDAIHVRDLYDPDGWADYLWRKLGQGASALRSVSPATDDAPTDLTPSRFDRPEKCGSRPAHRVRRGPHPSPKVWREVPS